MVLLVEDAKSFAALAARLNSLLDSDPRDAINTARQARGKGELKTSVHALRAGILIDGGGQLKDEALIKEGISSLKRLILRDRNNGILKYNLANGLAQLIEVEKCDGPEWYVRTTASRREAKRLYQEVTRSTESPQLRAKARINLGNQLVASARWIEAYDQWARAVIEDPLNGVASLVATKMLLRRIRGQTEESAVFARVAGYYARKANRLRMSIASIAGVEASKMVKSLPTFSSRWKPRALDHVKDAFGRFVAEHRLALVGAVEGLDLRRRHWDDIHLQISEGIDRPAGVPPVFAMFNQLKADYCAARWLVFQFDHQPPPETSLYMDTLDYALYGAHHSLLQMAQRSALDILDRVAVCANEYFEIGNDPNDIHFRVFWRESDGVGPWRAEWKDELKKGNPGILALGDLASDLSNGGMLAIQRTLRNVGTHRFAVLHDLGIRTDRPTKAIDHYELEEFRENTIDALRIVRSAILYLRDAVNSRERRRSPDKLVVSMPLVSHDYIRGRSPRPRKRD